MGSSEVCCVVIRLNAWAGRARPGRRRAEASGLGSRPAAWAPILLAGAGPRNPLANPAPAAKLPALQAPRTDVELDEPSIHVHSTEPVVEAPSPPKRRASAPKGHARPRRRGRRRALIAAGIIVTLLVLIGAPAAYAVNYIENQARNLQNSVSRELSTGQAQLAKSKSDLAKAASNRSLDDLATSRELNASARAHFEKAQQLADHNSLVKEALQYPYAREYVRPRIAAVDAIAQMGLAISATIEDGAGIDETLIKTDTVPGAGAAKLMAVLKAAQPDIDNLEAHLVQAQKLLATIDAAILTSSQKATLSSARDTINKGLAGVTSLKAMIPAIFEIMGANGPRTYLITQVNPAELRAGGGFIGSFSVIDVNNGTFKQIKSAGVETLDSYRPTVGQYGYVAPPATMKQFEGRNSWYFGDTNFFPDFPTNAQWAETFAQKQIGVKPDGVISLDPQAVAYMLGVTGPIKVPGYNVTVDANTFVQFLFDYENGPNRQANRKQLLGATANEIIADMTNLTPTQWPALVTAINKAAQEHHIQMFFNNQTAQSQIGQYSWTGALNQDKSPDFMYEVEDNFGGSKANHFLVRSYDVTLTHNGATLHHKVDIHSSTDINGVKNIPQDWPNYGFYMRLYVPANATNTSGKPLFPDQYPNTDVPSGLKLIDGWNQFNVDHKTLKGEITITFEYDTPWQPDAAGKQKVYWQKQPGTNADPITVTFVDGSLTAKATSTLNEDREIVAGRSGVTVQAPPSTGAELPAISF